MSVQAGTLHCPQSEDSFVRMLLPRCPLEYPVFIATTSDKTADSLAWSAEPGLVPIQVINKRRAVKVFPFSRGDSSGEAFTAILYGAQ